jgi:hypothetical protein
MIESRDAIYVPTLHTQSSIPKVQMKLRMLRGQEIDGGQLVSSIFDLVLSECSKDYVSIMRAYHVGRKGLTCVVSVDRRFMLV